MLKSISSSNPCIWVVIEEEGIPDELPSFSSQHKYKVWKVKVLRSAKPDDGLDPVVAASRPLEEMKIDSPTGTADKPALVEARFSCSAPTKEMIRFDIIININLSVCNKDRIQLYISPAWTPVRVGTRFWLHPTNRQRVFQGKQHLISQLDTF